MLETSLTLDKKTISQYTLSIIFLTNRRVAHSKCSWLRIADRKEESERTSGLSISVHAHARPERFLTIEQEDRRFSLSGVLSHLAPSSVTQCNAASAGGACETVRRAVGACCKGCRPLRAGAARFGRRRACPLSPNKSTREKQKQRRSHQTLNQRIASKNKKLLVRENMK